MAITTALIKELRERTQAGMMDCKKALMETEGDIEKAIDWLREKGIAKAAKKSGRIAAEGLVFGGERKNKGVIIEFNSETDFVAKNDDFKKFGELLVNVSLDNNISTVEELKAFEVDGKTVEILLTELIAKIGENMNIRRMALIESEGIVTTYIHLGGKIGVIVELSGEDTEENKAKGHDVALQAAAMDPRFTFKSEVTPEILEHEKEIQRTILLEEGKNPELVEKILLGKMNKFYEENCLENQKFVKDDKITIEKLLSPAKLVSFVRFKVGEGIEKEEVDFAAEVAAQILGK